MAKGPWTVDTLPDGIAEHWGLEPDPASARLGGGYHNLLVRAGDVVVRIEEHEPESVVWEHDLLAWLAPAVPEVVAPLAAPDGSTFLELDGRVYSVLPYVDGVPLTRGGENRDWVRYLLERLQDLE